MAPLRRLQHLSLPVWRERERDALGLKVPRCPSLSLSLSPTRKQVREPTCVEREREGRLGAEGALSLSLSLSLSPARKQVREPGREPSKLSKVCGHGPARANQKVPSS
jgi:hypothetical protein